METTAAAKPAIFASGTDIPGGSLTCFESVEILGSDLKPGMLLVDRDFGCPVYFLDSRRRPTQRSGAAAFLVHDMGRGTIRTDEFHRNTTVPVATKVID